jgi:hypothetical protein
MVTTRNETRIHEQTQEYQNRFGQPPERDARF